MLKEKERQTDRMADRQATVMCISSFCLSPRYLESMFVSLEVLALDIMPSVCCLRLTSPFSLTTVKIQSRMHIELYVTAIGNATVNIVTVAMISPRSAQHQNSALRRPLTLFPLHASPLIQLNWSR